MQKTFLNWRKLPIQIIPFFPYVELVQSVIWKDVLQLVIYKFTVVNMLNIFMEIFSVWQ